MKEFIVFLSVISFSYGIQYDGLRVTYGSSEALADKEYFYKIPRTIAAAESEGWRRTERPPGPMEELMLYCSLGRTVCTLYAPSGFVAGLQIAVPVDEFISPLFDPASRFVKWSVPSTEGEPGRDYWTITQYYVSEESLKSGTGPQVENGATLQDGGVWINDLEGQLMRIPSTEAELKTTIFKKQNCIPNMGTHYHYNMSRETSCDALLHWFAQTTEGSLVGVGFQMFGKLTKPPRGRDWFDVLQTGRQFTEMAIPLAPECFYKLAVELPVLSLHVYYIDSPWNLKCRDGDSAKPVAEINGIALSDDRNSSVMSDSMK